MIGVAISLVLVALGFVIAVRARLVRRRRRALQREWERVYVDVKLPSRRMRRGGEMQAAMYRAFADELVKAPRVVEPIDEYEGQPTVGELRDDGVRFTGPEGITLSGDS